MAGQPMTSGNSVKVHSAINQIPDSVLGRRVWRTIYGQVRVKN